MPLPTPKHKPDFPALMTPSPALAAWPPSGYRGFYQVGSMPGTSWKIAAWSWGIPDVWDLIWFNFRTDEPRRVNWYMHHYIGCWKSNDGKNFSFKDADPGFIYIPPLNWKRPQRMPLGSRVAEALSRLVPYFPPYVIYYTVHVSRTDLLHIIQGIRSGRIAVRHDPTLKGAVAEYHRDGDLTELILSSTSLTNLENRRTFIHEAVHAILDMKHYTLLRWQNEFIAYAIEAQFTFSKAPSHARRLLDKKDSINQIHAAALILASFTDADLKKGKAYIRLQDYNRLLAADAETWINPFVGLKSALLDYLPGAQDILYANGL